MKTSAVRSPVRDSTVRGVVDYESSAYSRPSHQMSGWTPGRTSVDPETSKRTAFSRVPGRDHVHFKQESHGHPDHLRYLTSKKMLSNRALDFSDPSSDNGSGSLDVKPRHSNDTETVAMSRSPTVSSGRMRAKSRQKTNSAHLLHSELSSESDENLHR